MATKQSPKIKKLVKQIKELSVDELKTLLEQLKDFLPPLEGAGVPAEPKDKPPALSETAKQEVPDWIA